MPIQDDPIYCDAIVFAANIITLHTSMIKRKVQIYVRKNSQPNNIMHMQMRVCPRRILNKVRTTLCYACIFMCVLFLRL